MKAVGDGAVGNKRRVTQSEWAESDRSGTGVKVVSQRLIRGYSNNCGIAFVSNFNINW
jgi:hypothetical protein